MPKVSRSMQAGVAQETGKTEAQEAAAQVQAEQQLGVGASAQQEANRSDAVQTDQTQAAKEQEDSAEREERKEEQKDDLSPDAGHDRGPTQREDTDRERADVNDATQQGPTAQAAHNSEVDRAQIIDEARRDGESLSETRDKAQLDEQRKGEERVADDRAQLDQASSRDQQQRQEQDVSRQGGKLLQESEAQQKATLDTDAAPQVSADTARTHAEPDEQARNIVQSNAAEGGAEMTASPRQAQTQAEQQTEDPLRTAFLNQLREKEAALGDLDDAALERVLGYANDHQKMRGQLVEEYGNQRLEQITKEMGPEYSFIRGDRIADQNNQQLTDGMIVREAQDDPGLLDVVGFAEAKAGRASRRELAASRESFDDISEKERANLQRTAIDEFLEQRGYGDPGTNRPEWTRSENVLSNHGAEIEALMRDLHGADIGQLRKDFERMMPNAGDSDVTVRIDGEDARIRVSPSQTEVYGVTPSDVATDRTFENFREKEPGIQTHSINIDQTASEIDALAKVLQDAEQQYRSNAANEANVQAADRKQAETEDRDNEREAADLLNLAEAQREASSAADKSMDRDSRNPASWNAVAAAQDRAQTALNTDVDELERSRELARLRSRKVQDLDEAMELFDDV